MNSEVKNIPCFNCGLYLWIDRFKQNIVVILYSQPAYMHSGFKSCYQNFVASKMTNRLHIDLPSIEHLLSNFWNHSHIVIGVTLKPNAMVVLYKLTHRVRELAPSEGLKNRTRF